MPGQLQQLWSELISNSGNCTSERYHLQSVETGDLQAFVDHFSFLKGIEALKSQVISEWKIFIYNLKGLSIS